MTARLIIGDALEVVRSLPDASVDCLLTSPPYFNQRAYLPDDDPTKATEMGQEDTPGDFLEAALVLMDAVWPKLSDDGTFWIVIGDTHAGSGGAGGDYNEGGLRDGQQRFDGTARKARASRRRDRAEVAAPRDATGPRRPSIYRDPAHDGGPLRDRAADEANGIRPKLKRTRRQLEGWPLEQSVCWLPHLLGASLAYGRNLLTGAEHEQWVTRPPVTWCKLNPTVGRLTRTFRTATELVLYGGKHQGHYFDLDAVRVEPKHGFEFDNRVIPTLRDVASPHPPRKTNGSRDGKRINSHPDGAPPLNWWVVNTVPYHGAHFAVFPPELVIRPVVAGCPEGGTVLDPFAGSGTTLAVATGHGRHAIGIDLDERNADLARQRVGMFLDVEHHQSQENVG